MDNEYLKRIYGLLESGVTLGTGAVSGLVGLPYGLYKGVTSGAYGTPEAPRIAAREAQQFIERNTYQPRTAEGQANLQQLAGLLEASKLPPVMPEASLLAAIQKQAYAAQAERAGMAAEKAIAPVVTRTMERGGLPAQLLGDLSQGSVRPVVLMHGGKAPITTIDPEKLIQSVQSSGFHTTNKAYTPFSFATNQNKSEGVVSAFDFPDELYARTLNYDKPISQSPYVMDAISNLVEKDESLRQKMIGEVKNLYKAAKESGEDINAQDVMTGKQFHSLLRRHYGGLKEADAVLENVGITGASWQYSAKRPDEIATAIYPKYAEQLKAIGQYQASPDDLQGMTKNINKDIGLLGQSKAAESAPVQVYHGSKSKMITELDPSKSFGDLGVSWVTPEEKFAQRYAGKEGKVYKMDLSEGKNFDFSSKEDIAKLKDAAKEVEYYDPVRGFMTLDKRVPDAGDWKNAEDPRLFNLIKDMGYDSVSVYEDGVRNIGVFNPKKALNSSKKKQIC